MSDAKQVLECKMGPNDAKASTVREYLKALLTTLWQKEEGFSGKRPFGNSSWKYDVYTALLHAKLIQGKLDADGYIEECDDAAADRLIEQAIASF